MIELPFVLVAGILGSSHCIGMCGGFALTIGAGANSVGMNLLRQLTFSLGRVFMYTALGALVGYTGMRLELWSQAVDWASVLALSAGAFLVYQGLATAGLLTWRSAPSVGGVCLASTFFASFLRGPRATHVFTAGMLTGLLPCGLLYGMLVLAAATGSALAGSAVMATFALGTLPLMVLTGCGTSFLSVRNRRRLYTAAAWCVVVTGLITMARGVGVGVRWAEGNCPMCFMYFSGQHVADSGS